MWTSAQKGLRTALNYASMLMVHTNVTAQVVTLLITMAKTAMVSAIFVSKDKIVCGFEHYTMIIHEIQYSVEMKMQFNFSSKLEWSKIERIPLNVFTRASL